MGATRGQLAAAKGSRVWEEDKCACNGHRRRAHVWDAKMDGMHAPLFVIIYKPWHHRADVRAGANKQENDEKDSEGLEVEQGGLRKGPRSELVVSVS